MTQPLSGAGPRGPQSRRSSQRSLQTLECVQTVQTKQAKAPWVGRGGSNRIDNLVAICRGKETLRLLDARDGTGEPRGIMRPALASAHAAKLGFERATSSTVALHIFWKRLDGPGRRGAAPAPLTTRARRRDKGGGRWPRRRACRASRPLEDNTCGAEEQGHKSEDTETRKNGKTRNRKIQKPILFSKVLSHANPSHVPPASRFSPHVVTPLSPHFFVRLQE